MQILQHEQQRGDIRHIGQQPRHPLEQPQPPVHVPHATGAGPQQPLHHGVRGQSGGEPLIAREHTQHLGERQIRQPDVPEIHAMPGDDGHPGRGGPPGHLVQHPRLTDPGVPGDQHGPGLTGTSTLQHAGEPLEFGIPPDNGRDR